MADNQEHLNDGLAGLVRGDHTIAHQMLKCMGNSGSGVASPLMSKERLPIDSGQIERQLQINRIKPCKSTPNNK